MTLRHAKYKGDLDEQEWRKSRIKARCTPRRIRFTAAFELVNLYQHRKRLGLRSASIVSFAQAL
jgi:hypothetical protein